VAQLLVALGDYPHTRPLTEGTATVDGCSVAFADIEPIHRAFGPMVRELRYDVCELAITTLLQAREAGVPITMLPLAMNGDGHHRSLNRRPDRASLAPADLIGGRVAVRAYTQTTGMWVRGLLREEHGIDAEQITWMTTEGPHVDSYHEPEFVQRAEASVATLVAEDVVDAAIVGPRALTAEGLTLEPVFADADAADNAWIARHGTIPINHLVAVRTDLVQSEPGAIGALYRALRDAILATADQRDATAHGRAVRCGWTEELRVAIEIAGRFGVEQGLLRGPADVEALEAQTASLEL